MLPPLRVLIADDYPDQTNSLALLARAWNHDVQIAYDGTQALQVAKAFLPDAMVVDLQMPGLHGYSLARQVRQDSNLTGSVLIAVSGLNQPDVREQSISAGFDFFARKPFDPVLLERILRNIQKAKALVAEVRQAIRDSGTTRAESDALRKEMRAFFDDLGRQLG